MAIYTQLSLIAIPGRRHSFIAKAPAVGGKGEGPFTSLSALGIPGAIHSFVAKEPAIPSEKGEGLFTALSVLTLPGGRHIFLPKEAGEIVVPPEKKFIYDAGGGVGYGLEPEWMIQERLRRRILKDDNELLEMLTLIIPFLG